MPKTDRVKRDLYAEVTAQVQAALDAGVVPWKRPWQSGADAHRNPVSGTVYRGVNPMLLELRALTAGYGDRQWLTFKGAQSAGGSVRKGEHGQMVVFFKMLIAKGEDAEGVEVARPIPMLRHFTVFNVAQIDGLELPEVDAPEVVPFIPMERCEEVAAGYLARAEGLTLAHGGDRAFYQPNLDHLGMPDREMFDAPAFYYSTLFHEMGHSTGHVSRLARKDLVDTAGMRSKSYAREELTAEMTAAMLCGYADILPEQLGQSAAYIASWRKALADDPRCVVVAAQRAQKAADLILDRSAVREEVTA